MVSDKLLWNTEPSNDMVEYKMHGCLIVGFNHGNSLIPFCEIVNKHYNMLMPQAEAGLQSMESSPHLVKGPTVMMGHNGAGRERIFHANTWQGWHFLTASTQSLKIDGQK